MPVGLANTVHVNTRFIAATNRCLREDVSTGRFREDLFYRLNVIPIHIPPIRKRKDDIALLANYFLKKYAEKEKKNVVSLSPEAVKMLTGYHWPGNVRELENAIERAVILTGKNTIMPEDFPVSVRDSHKRTQEVEVETEETTLEEIEKRHILKTLEKANWNQKQASEILGISTTTLWRKLKLYGIEPKMKE
jgi:transcriptional regulator with PAS, ATPase and Fis domain